MQDTSYTDALRPPSAIVFKLPLRNYSIGHELLLLRERNAFLVQSPSDFKKLPLEQQIFYLDRATWICSNSFSQNKFEWFGRLKTIWLAMRRRKMGLADYEKEIENFWNYLNAGRLSPRTSRRRLEPGEKPGRPFGAPLLAQLQSYVVSLPEIRGISNPEQMLNAVWDYPFGAALWRYFVKMELEGSLQIENTDEEESRLKAEQQKNDYDTACNAWRAAVTDEEKQAALKAHPDLRNFADTEESVRAFESKGKTCPA